MSAEPVAAPEPNGAPEPTDAAERIPGRRPTRLLGTVGIEEAARLVGVSPSAIRLWERQGLVAPRRTDGGTRRFDGADLERLVAVRTWRSQGLNAAAIRRLAPGDMTGGQGTPPTTDRSVPSATVAARLKALRATRGLTLRAAASRSGLSVSFISSLERGLSGASLAALRRLLEAYGATVGELGGLTDRRGVVDGLPPGDRGGGFVAGAIGVRRLVRSSDRRVLDAAPGVRIEDLFGSPSTLESQLFVLAPGASSEGYYAHPGEEFMYVLAGSLGVWLADAESYRLEPGDALTFPSTLEHRIAALGPDETRVIWVNTPPTF